MLGSAPTTVVAPPFGTYDNAGIWWDRDGVDPYQSATYANTGGKYDIVITYRAVNAGLGTMMATINGKPTGFGTYPDYSDFNPAGLSFKGDMTQMQVFVGAWWGAGTGGNINVSNLEVNGVPVPEPSTYLAGALLLLPFGVGALRAVRRGQKNRA